MWLRPPAWALAPWTLAPGVRSHVLCCSPAQDLLGKEPVPAGGWGAVFKYQGLTEGRAIQQPVSPGGGLRRAWGGGGDRGRKRPRSVWLRGHPVPLSHSLAAPRAWPDPVFEGDALTLRCHGSANNVLSQVKFYKDRRLFQTPKTRWSLSVGIATLESSGQYSCSGKVAYVPYLGRQTSELVKVQVQEPFPPPVLSAVPSPELREGSPLTLRCQTKLHPQKSASRLLFSFHRDASTLQDRGPHTELCLPGAQERDSGLSWCRATLEGGVTQKQSPQLEVRVQDARLPSRSVRAVGRGSFNNENMSSLSWRLEVVCRDGRKERNLYLDPGESGSEAPGPGCQL
ncbi:Fc receptor-like protein 6 [Panthera leo]|uniref:Fc receptor-like protein 6 n=1 Tax=Panthera leo TaxID=9689 RepID=UPI001C69570C|nr:Fc receptor-like protein 6 [Panthera leo]